MYQEFFGLKEAPFNLTPDPRFLYLSRRHQEALASLVYGIKEQKGFILLSGEIGSGKTTLCRAFINELNPETTNVALVLNSFLNDLELLQTINDEFGIASESDSKKALIDGLNRYLLEENEKGNTQILIVDEAQNLSPAVLEQIRMLSNLETDKSKLIQIILMGQPELVDLLNRSDLEQLNQRIMVRCHIAPLDKREIYHYIRHRLEIAGAKINISLTAQALNRLYHFSGGVPRKINLLCDRALLAAYVAGSFQIDAKMIAAAEKELRSTGASPLRARRLTRAMKSSRLATTAVVVVVVGLLSCFLIGLRVGVGTGQKKSSDPGAGSSIGLQAAAPALPTPRLPSLEDIPVPAAVPLEEEWVYDADDIVRVSDPRMARKAALLTVAKLWMFAFDNLEDWRNYDSDTLLGLNLLQILKKPQIDLQSYITAAPLREVIAVDLPMVLELKEPVRRLSPVVVLMRVEEGRCTLADPRLGRVELALALLENLVERIIVVYHDPENLAALARGEKSESMAALRVFLAEQGVWQGKAGDAFGEEMVEAIKRFQQICNQEPSGELDGPTAARIAAGRQTIRPHLLHGNNENF